MPNTQFRWVSSVAALQAETGMVSGEVATVKGYSTDADLGGGNFYFDTAIPAGAQITNATNASPIVVTTSSAHGLSNDQFVLIAGVAGNTAANGFWRIANKTTTTFELVGSNGNGSYTSGGVIGNRGTLVPANNNTGIWKRLYTGPISVRWFGATADGNTIDDWAAIQAAIDHVVAQTITTCHIGTLHFPSGKYLIGTPLQIRRKHDGSYTYCSINMMGDAPGYGTSAFHGSALMTTFSDGPALVIQSARAVKVENIIFQGKNNWASLSGRDPGNMATHYNDANYLATSSVRDNRYSPHAGIHIDPYNAAVALANKYPALTSEYINSGTGGGSSQVRIHGCEFRDFVVGIGISLNGITQNAENITIADCTISSTKSAIAVGQDQSRNITVRNLSAAGHRTVFDCTGYGEGSGNCPSVFGANVGGVKYIFQTYSFGGTVSVNGLYAENVYSIGTLGGSSAADSHVLNGCQFKFGGSPAGMPAIGYRLANLTFTVLNGCTFSLQAPEPIYIHNLGYMTMTDCSFPANSPEVSPRFWVNGNRERVSHNQTIMATTPAGSVLSGILPFETKSSIIDQPMVPGSLFYSTRDVNSPPSLRWVSGTYPYVDLGNNTVTVGSDGTATFPTPAAYDGRIAIGDFIWSLTQYSVFEPPYDANTISIVIGKVTAVTSSLVTLEYVPGVATSGTHRLLAMHLPRVHLPTTGKMNFSTSNVDITNVTNISAWRVNERIRDDQGLIAPGTFVQTVDTVTNTIVLSRPASGSGNVDLILYDADVREINTTQVY